MSDTNESNPELVAKAAELVTGNATDVVAAVADISDPQLLSAALDAEKAGKERVTVVAALTAALNPPEPTVEYVDMVRDEPQHPGGPVTAQVHPDEVDNFSAGGWNKA